MTIVQGSPVPEGDGEAEKHEGTYAIKELNAVAIDVEDDAEEDEWEDGLHGSSCCCFGKESPTRHFCWELVKNPKFDKFVIGAVVAYILLCFVKLFTKLDQQSFSHSTTMMFMMFIEIIFLTIFFLECATKVIARGFMFGQDAYLKQPYNGLDFAVLLIATSQFLLHFNRHADDDSTPAHSMTGVEMLRGLRILAIFEPCMRQLKPICRAVR